MISARWKKFAGWVLALSVMVALPAFGAEKKWPIEGYWLPEQASTYADSVDKLFYAILYLTGFVFILTEGLLLIFLVKYRRQEGRKSVYSHGNHTLEMVWTLIPALILGIIAFVQKDAWDNIKRREFPKENKDALHVKLYAQQFQWNFRYAGNDGKWNTKDDVFENNKLVVPVNTDIVIEETSKDVIHSFFLPYMRLKQDAVPGMQIKCWFNATKTTEEMQKKRSADWDYDIVCAELCGNNHSQMRGLLKVLDKEEFKKWYTERSGKFGSGDAEIDDTEAKLWKTWQIDEDGNRVFPVAEKKEEKSEGHH